jgi:hypothetical protein
MPPIQTECTSTSYDFGRVNQRKLVADFKGGDLSSDGGLLLIREIDQMYRLSERLSECFTDHRDANRVQHDLNTLIAQRLYGLVQGYEDLNDHDDLRHDRMFGVALGQLESEHPRCAPLAGKSTLNRLEQAMHVASDLSDSRYIKMSLTPSAVERLLVELFIEQREPEPKRIILDLDVTDDSTHGEQVGSAFNGYYQHECYTPLLIFCGRHLLSAKLRPANVDPAEGALAELQRIIAQIRVHWPAVQVIVRGDSAYSRDDIMSWCEGQEAVEFVTAHSSNARLREMTGTLEQRAKAAYEAHRQAVATSLEPLLGQSRTELDRELDRLVPPQVWYQSLSYRTLDSWSRERRVVCKLTYDGNGPRRHFVVTSFSTQQVPPARLHRDFYCPRGEMENRIKEHQLDLFSDRTSTHEFESNQLRLWFSSFAYVLMQALRLKALAHTELADAQCGTIRRKLLKLGAQMHFSVRRIRVAFSSATPIQALFQSAYQRLQQRSLSG